MSPWDELQFFAFPTENLFSNSTPNSTTIAQKNPNRVWLEFSVTATVSGMTISTRINPTTNSGTALTAGFPQKYTAKDDPAIVQAEWYANIPVGVILTVREVVMLRWPRETSDNPNN